MKYSFIGPTFGSFLDILGGYPLPFYTVGSIIMILSICSTIFMPNKNIEVKSKAAFNNNQLKVWTVFMVKKRSSTLNTLGHLTIHYNFSDPSNVLAIDRRSHLFYRLCDDRILLDTISHIIYCCYSLSSCPGIFHHWRFLCSFFHFVWSCEKY